MTVSDLAGQLGLLNTIIQKDLGLIEDRRAVPGWQARQNQAREQLIEVRQRYREAVKKAAFPIWIEPNEHDTKLAEFAEDEGAALTIRADALAVRIAKRVEPVLGSRRVFGPDAASHALDEFMKIMREMDVVQAPVPAFHQRVDRVVTTFDDLLAVVKDSLASGPGQEFTAMFMEHELLDLAEKEKYSQNVVPVVVLGSEKESPLYFLPQNKGFFVGATSDTNEIIKVFNKIKAIVTGQTAEARSEKPKSSKVKKTKEADAGKPSEGEPTSE